MSLVLDGNGLIGGLTTKPMFSAYQSTYQSLAAATWTKVQLQTKDFDLTNAFDNVTNFRFQPTMAGYYQVNFNASVNVGGNAVSSCLYKNSGLYRIGSQVLSSGAQQPTSSGSFLVYLNGTSDYIELYIWCSSAQNTLGGGATSIQAHYISNGA